MNETPRLWTSADLAEHLGVTVGTIRKWRMQGKNPPELRINGVIRYDPDAVREWMKEAAGRD